MFRLALVVFLLAAALPAQQASTIDAGMKSLAQVAIVTRDIEASAARWAAVLGQPVPKISTTRPGQEVKMQFRGKPANGQAKLAFLSVGQVTIELIQPVGADTSWRQFLDEHGEGVQHLGFNVQNLDQAVANAGKAGMPVLHRGRYDGDNGDYVYVDSAKQLGVTLELLHSDPKKP